MSGQTERPGGAKWTFMVYLAGDNNLENYGDRDLTEMKRVGSGPGSISWHSSTVCRTASHDGITSPVPLHSKMTASRSCPRLTRVILLPCQPSSSGPWQPIPQIALPWCSGTTDRAGKTTTSIRRHRVAVLSVSRPPTQNWCVACEPHAQAASSFPPASPACSVPSSSTTVPLIFSTTAR